MRNCRILLIGFLFLLLLGCSKKSSRFPGYSMTETGIHYKLISLGDGSAKPEILNYITVNISYRTIKDSLFFQGLRKFQLTVPRYKGSIEECFLMLVLGDSASFYFPADSFFVKTLETSRPRFINKGDLMRADIKMMEIQTEKQYQLEKEAFLNWINDFGDYERVILKQYMDGEKLSIAPTSSGLYYIPIIKKEGKSVAVGDTITVNFEGRFFNSKIFDSTKKRNEPFQFVYGQKWQVIEGLEEAIGMMKEGEKSLFIIPSKLAFGEKGSSTGIIPPFTSVIFEVELIEVKKGKG
ncbi:MAG: FKBP-type peptidyl-prolyl cis-trans isomerase [Bacteroidales bacterium]|nr:FKBP-type peptidyl-prolyl cis-trans isomerase [Bacteroidales bacterium]